jgi:hypothetical protein
VEDRLGSFLALSEPVRIKIRERFSPADYEHAAMLLLQYDAGREAERIHLDILEICASSLEKIQQLVRLANQDYRDLISLAEYDLIDGELVLKPQFAKRKG